MAATKTRAAAPADDLTTERGIVRRLAATTSRDDWNDVRRRVRDANGADAAWTRRIVTSGALYERASAGWGGGS